ncbi:MAG TPA: 50S ribosomal protein L1 [Candidatus Saccharimonadales bacterium]|nr:50S ribosomal protein L1 [Candidatus Saccharimonadales bacterium]
MAASKKKPEAVESEAAEVEAAAVETTEAPIDTEDVTPDTDVTPEDERLSGDGGDADNEAHTTKAGRHSAKAQREADAEATRKTAAAEHKDEPDEPKAKPKPIQRPNPLNQHGKAYRAAAELIDATKRYEIDEAVTLAKQTAKTKFDASVELHINLGVDSRQADQMVRATVVLPSGTGKNLRVAVLAAADKHTEAKKAGAEIISDGDLLAKIEKGQLNFDVLVATPEMMPKLGKVAKVLGPRGLMPNPKSGSVTTNVGAAVEQAKAGRVEFRIDKQAIVHTMIGKASFSEDKLAANIKALIEAILKAKPAAAKGTYVNAITLTTSMGPGIKLDIQKAIAAANPKR